MVYRVTEAGAKNPGQLGEDERNAGLNGKHQEFNSGQRQHSDSPGDGGTGRRGPPQSLHGDLGVGIPSDTVTQENSLCEKYFSDSS